MSVKILYNIFYPPVQEIKDFVEKNNDLYFAINGGSTLKNDEWAKKWLQFDDEGDNISDLNSKVNEMTAMYWAIKHYDKLGNPDYIGFNHYRRIFNRDTIQDYDKYDIIVAKGLADKTVTIGMQYFLLHNKNDMQICCNILSKTYPAFGKHFIKYINESKVLYAPCNMFVMKKELFQMWCTFIFPVIGKLLDSIDLTGRDDYQKRAICFLVERIFGFWVYYTKIVKNLNVKYVDIEKHLEYKNNKLNERSPNTPTEVEKILSIALKQAANSLSNDSNLSTTQNLKG